MGSSEVRASSHRIAGPTGSRANMWPARSSAKRRTAGQPASRNSPVGIDGAAERDVRDRVVLAVDDRQGDGLLGLLERLVLEDRRVGLHEQVARDRERPGDQVGAVHHQGIGEEPPLRMPADEVMLDRINLLEVLHRLADQRRALAVGAGEALVGALAHEVDVGEIERRAFVAREPGWGLAVDPQEDVILGDVGPGDGHGVDVRLAVHVRAVEHQRDGPLLRRRPPCSLRGRGRSRSGGSRSSRRRSGRRPGGRA